jgi:hypothetical protein
MNSDILIKLKPVFERLNLKQRAIANNILSDKKYLIGEFKGQIVVRDTDGDVYSFYEFVKAKCNCN